MQGPNEIDAIIALLDNKLPTCPSEIKLSSERREFKRKKKVVDKWFMGSREGWMESDSYEAKTHL